MFQSKNYYKIGDSLIYDGNKYRIVYVKMDFEDSTLVFTYKLKHENGIKWRKKYNSKLSGASIIGKIIKVNRDNLKLHLSIDETQNVSDAAFFQVAIGYTAEGNTGIYSAMDEGEQVKLFFPSADEKDAYVRCIDKNDSETSEHFSTPKNKSYGTPYGSTISVTEKGISISNVKDSIFINMNEEDGITFHSAEDIHIYTEKKLSMECKKLTISSKERIILNTEGSNIIVDETMHFKTKG